MHEPKQQVFDDNLQDIAFFFGTFQDYGLNQCVFSHYLWSLFLLMACNNVLVIEEMPIISIVEPFEHSVIVNESL